MSEDRLPNRLEITSPGKLPMGQTLERMKEGYSKIRNEALVHAFSYMNLIEHWGSGIPRIIGKVKAAGLREPEFIGGEVDLRINIYRGQTNAVTGSDNTGIVPDSADKAPNNADTMPQNCRILTKNCRIVLKDCRIMSRNERFINMYWKMVSLQVPGQQSF